MPGTRSEGSSASAPLFRQRLRQRDPAAWEALYEACGDRVWRTAHKILPSRMDPEGAAQQTWVRAMHRIRRLAAGRDPVPWIMAICVNLCISVIRRERSKRRVMVRKVRREGPTGEKTKSGWLAEEASSVRKGVAGLGRSLQEIVYLRYACDMPTSEISEMLNLSVNAVRKRLKRAQDELRATLDPTLPDPNGAAPSFEEL